MDRYARSHFADQSLLTAAENHAGQERTSMADLLADLAEIDKRSLHVPMAYRSLHEYCTARLRLAIRRLAYRRQPAPSPEPCNARAPSVTLLSDRTRRRQPPLVGWGRQLHGAARISTARPSQEDPARCP